jgi:hypothetical protein
VRIDAGEGLDVHDRAPRCRWEGIDVVTAAELAGRPVLQRIVAVACAIVGVTGVATAIGHDGDTLGPGEARLRVDGEVIVSHPDGTTDTVGETSLVHVGDRVEAVEGTFSLTFVDEEVVEGRAATAAGDRATKVEVGRRVELEAGSMLVTAPDGATVTAAGNVVQLEPAGDGTSAMRVDRSLAVAATSYEGLVTVDSAGQRRTVPALREMEVAVLGRPPTAPRPLRYDERDAWDQRFLSSAIDLSHRLDAFSRAYGGTLRPGEGTTVGFYQLLLPALEAERDFTQALLGTPPARSPGELLVGAAITSLGRTGSFAGRWEQVFSFRDAGATWGLVAMDQGVSSGPLIDGVEAALEATRFEFAQTAAELTRGTPTSLPPETSTPVTSPPATTTTAPPPPTTEPPPTTQPPLPPPVPPVPETGVGLIDDVVDPIVDLVGGLLGG